MLIGFLPSGSFDDDDAADAFSASPIAGDDVSALLLLVSLDSARTRIDGCCPGTPVSRKPNALLPYSEYLPKTTPLTDDVVARRDAGIHVTAKLNSLLLVLLLSNAPPLPVSSATKQVDSAKNNTCMKTATHSTATTDQTRERESFKDDDDGIHFADASVYFLLIARVFVLSVSCTRGRRRRRRRSRHTYG